MKPKTISGSSQQAAKLFPAPLCLANDPTLPGPLKTGIKYHQAGDLNRASRYYAERLKTSPQDPRGLVCMGSLLAQTGYTERADALVSRALKHDSHLADAHFTQAALLQANRQQQVAKIAYIRALALGHPLAEQRLEYIYRTFGAPSRLHGEQLLVEVLLSLGKHREAFQKSRKLLSSYPDNSQSWELFSRCLLAIRFQSRAQGDIVKDLARVLTVEGINHQLIVGAALSALRFEPEFAPLLALKDDIKSLYLPVSTSFAAGQLAPLSSHSLFCSLLNAAVLNDVHLENLLTALRRALLECLTTEEPHKPALVAQHMGLLCGIAQQCFMNEYLYVVDADESKLLDALIEQIGQQLASGRAIAPEQLAIIAAYRPLYELSYADSLTDTAWPDQLGGIIRSQLTEAMLEEQIKTEIPALTPVTASVSVQTRSEYEAYPFPRWPSLPTLGPKQNFTQYLTQHLPDQPRLNASSTASPEILVAGCGTGLDACFLAGQIENAQVTGVDLSLSSLAFATRKARALGLDNIRFMQADILELGGIDTQFDFINCFGVLQLLQDTQRGLEILRDRLAPGGIMLIALYSTLGRRAVAEARAFIEEQGYQACAEDMRQCRQDLITMHNRDFAGPIVDSLAFFNMGNFRDLIFHSSEKTFTLTEVEQMLEALNLEFLGFEISDPNVRNEYRQRFPQDSHLTSLENWHKFELEFPDTFANCHPFWLRKKT